MRMHNGTIKHLLCGLTILGGLVLTAGPMAAASATEPQVNGSEVGAPLARGKVETRISADDRPTVFRHAAIVRDGLGFPSGFKRLGVHVRDGLRKQEYDEITEVDQGDRPIHVTQFDTGGRLVAAVRFDSPKSAKGVADGSAAVSRARKSLAAVGVLAPGTPSSAKDDVGGGWIVSWQRFEGGFRVRGDETRVHVWDDGQIQSIGQVAHGLAPAPPTRLTVAQARSAAATSTAAWTARSGAQFAVGDMALQWVQPNAAFDPSKLDAAEQPGRLAWVVNVTPSGTASGYVTLITLFIDAGDGTLIGGDVVE